MTYEERMALHAEISEALKGVSKKYGDDMNKQANFMFAVMSQGAMGLVAINGTDLAKEGIKTLVEMVDQADLKARQGVVKH
jgi:hypothetical protein